jgi:hypothetical protein
MFGQRPFDPTPLLAEHLHKKLCSGHSSAIEPVDCLVVQAAMADYVADLAAAGLALVPADSVRFLQQLFEDATRPDQLEERPEGEGNESRSRAHAQTWLILRHQDGRVERGGPYQRWLAELLLCDMGYYHDPDVVAARLEGEPDWVDELLRELGDQAA